MQFVLGGGDDHALLATFPAGTDLPPGFRVVGRVLEGDDSGPAVTVDGEPYDGSAGHTHF